MPKASAVHGKITRRSTPLKPVPTLKVKTINRVRTASGRASSTTQKIERPIRPPSPTPAPLPSVLPESILTEALEVSEEEEQEVKTPKSPSRAVSVSPHHQRVVGGFSSQVK